MRHELELDIIIIFLAVVVIHLGKVTGLIVQNTVVAENGTRLSVHLSVLDGPSDELALGSLTTVLGLVGSFVVLLWLLLWLLLNFVPLHFE